MTEVQIRVVGAQAVEARKDGRLTTGMVGAVARFSFDRVWDGLTKVAVFKGSGVTKDVLEWDGNAVKIPPEVLREAGRLYVGVEGRNGDGSVVIPTVWADCGAVLCGANASGDPSTDPSLPVWAKIDSKIGDMSQLQTKAKESLVAAINEALRSGGGSVDEATVERIVEEYLAEHPPESGIHVGPEPPEDGSVLWADTDEDLPGGEDAVPAPPKAEVGQYLRVKEVDADGKVVATETVGTDTSLSVSGDPADAKKTGDQVRAIVGAMKGIERASRYLTTSGWVLSIDSVGMTVTVPAGMLACGNWCMALAEQTVAIVQDDATTLVVYDSDKKAVRSVRFADFNAITMYVIAVITAERYTDPNANWVQGPYLVDGVMVGGAVSGGAVAGEDKWRKLRSFAVPADTSTDTGGIEWTTTAEGGVIGFEFDTDYEGNAFECSELSIITSGNCANTGTIDFLGDGTSLCKSLGYQNTAERCGWGELHKRNGIWRWIGAWAASMRVIYDTQSVATTGFVGGSVNDIDSFSKFGITGTAAFNVGYQFDIWGR